MRWLPIVVALCACGDDRRSGACEQGETRECYTGPPGTESVGTCAPGLESCENGEFTGICIGDVTPFVEHCDGLDEDCSGEVDDVSGSGEACTNAEGCDGATACSGASLACVGPDRNACSVCGGVTVPDLGTACVANDCEGQLVCNGAGDGSDCNAPSKNDCQLCGGPAIVGLTANCVGAAACPGINVCNEDGDDVACDCNPQPGMCRAGGVFRPVVAPVVGDLVITEIMQSPGDDADREWFEVQVINDVDINQLELDRVGDSAEPNLISSVDCIRVTAGTRLVFARNLDPLENGNLPTPAGRFTFSLVNAGDVRILMNGAVLDAVTWTSATSNAAMQLDPDLISAASNDDENNFCDARTTYDDNDLGTPGAPNVQCLAATECLNTDGSVRTKVKPTVGQLVITEVLPDPAGTGTDATHEWFEITNVDPTDSFDLNDLGLKGNGAAIDLISSNDCKPLAAGGFALFARSTDSGVNGGLPAVDATFTSFQLANTSGSGVSVLDGATLLDAVTWATLQDGQAQMLETLNTNTVDNDVPANFCSASTDTAHDYDGAGAGLNFGTPKAANDCP